MPTGSTSRRRPRPSRWPAAGRPTSSAWPRRCALPSGRCSWPGAAAASSAPELRERWPTGPARCWPSRPSPRACSTTSDWSLGVSGGFASPLAAELIRDADLIVGWGCALNMWTMRHGKLIAPGATVVQVDDTADALGAHRDLDLRGPRRRRADRPRARWTRCRSARPGYRTDEVRRRLAGGVRWRDVPYDDLTGGGLIDPRTLTRDLDELLPAERVVAVDSGNFMGYPAMFLDVRDEQSASASPRRSSRSGSGWRPRSARRWRSPDRLTVAALGDGGALMSAAELETVARLGLPTAGRRLRRPRLRRRGAPLRPRRRTLDTVVFPDTDLAAIARGYGFDGVTVRARRRPRRRSRAWLDAGRPPADAGRRQGGRPASRPGGSRRRSAATERWGPPGRSGCEDAGWTSRPSGGC